MVGHQRTSRRYRSALRLQLQTCSHRTRRALQLRRAVHSPERSRVRQVRAKARSLSASAPSSRTRGVAMHWSMAFSYRPMLARFLSLLTTYINQKYWIFTRQYQTALLQALVVYIQSFRFTASCGYTTTVSEIVHVNRIIKIFWYYWRGGEDNQMLKILIRKCLVLEISLL